MLRHFLDLRGAAEQAVTDFRQLLRVSRDLLNRVADDVKELGKIENMPKMEGRQMIMMIGPLPQKT